MLRYEFSSRIACATPEIGFSTVRLEAIDYNLSYSPAEVTLACDPSTSLVQKPPT